MLFLCVSAPLREIFFVFLLCPERRLADQALPPAFAFGGEGVGEEGGVGGSAVDQFHRVAHCKKFGDGVVGPAGDLGLSL